MNAKSYSQVALERNRRASKAHAMASRYGAGSSLAASFVDALRAGVEDVPILDEQECISEQELNSLLNL